MVLRLWISVLTKLRILNMSSNFSFVLVRLANNSGPIMHMDFSNNLLLMSWIAPTLINFVEFCFDLFIVGGICCPFISRKTNSGLRLLSEAPHRDINDEISCINFIATFLMTLNLIVLKKQTNCLTFSIVLFFRPFLLCLFCLLSIGLKTFSKRPSSFIKAGFGLYVNFSKKSFGLYRGAVSF